MKMRKEVKRTRAANQLAKIIVDVATGKQESSLEVASINEFARARGEGCQNLASVAIT